MFYYNNLEHPEKEPRPEIISGIIREGQLASLCGELNTGKTPILKDWAIAVAAGLNWCGCATTQRPVIMLDLESDDGAFDKNMNSIILRRGLSGQNLPIGRFLRLGDLDDPKTASVEVMLDAKVTDRIAWIGEQLDVYPDALFIIDPIQMVFNIDKNKSQDVTALFSAFRKMRRKYPQASFIFVYNLRKENDGRKEPPNLLTDPQGWLQEISGSMDLQNRVDVRLGMTLLTRGEKEPIVLNGLRRGETMEPFLLESEYLAPEGAEKPPQAGFRRVHPEDVDTAQVFVGQKYALWTALGEEFTMAEAIDESSTGTAYRMVEQARQMGLLVEETGRFRKVVG